MVLQMCNKLLITSNIGCIKQCTWIVASKFGTIIAYISLTRRCHTYDKDHKCNDLKVCIMQFVGNQSLCKCCHEWKVKFYFLCQNASLIKIVLKLKVLEGCWHKFYTTLFDNNFDVFHV